MFLRASRSATSCARADGDVPRSDELGRSDKPVAAGAGSGRTTFRCRAEHDSQDSQRAGCGPGEDGIGEPPRSRQTREQHRTARRNRPSVAPANVLHHPAMPIAADRARAPTTRESSMLHRRKSREHEIGAVNTMTTHVQQPYHGRSDTVAVGLVGAGHADLGLLHARRGARDRPGTVWARHPKPPGKWASATDRAARPSKRLSTE